MKVTHEKTSAEKLENGVVVVDLGREFSRAEIKNFVEREKAERQIVENILKPKFNYPKVAMAIRVLAEYLSQKVEQIKKENRETIGRQLLEPAMREIFATPFRDRVVHHLIYNLVDMWMISI